MNFPSTRLVALFLSLTVTGVSAPLRVAYSYWFACVPLHIAESHGFWTKRGLEVQITSFDTGLKVDAALKRGEIDLGYDMLGAWFDLIQDGAPIMLVGETDWSNGGDKLLIRTGKNLGDLRGQPLVVYQNGSAVKLFLREALKRAKIPIGDFKLVEISDDAKMKDDFAKGRINLVASYDPIAQEVIAMGAKVLATTEEFPGIMPEGFAVTRGFLTPQGDADLEKFFAGWFEAVRYLHDPANRAEIAKLASEKTFAGTEKISEEDVVTNAKTQPVHLSDFSLQRNDLAAKSAGEFITSIRVLWLQQGRPMTP